ncbi:uncharacterized protein LOC128724821 [Anopheles nili]|uniref:uncharacterized protein LOC128724821 n=1 Tax=Anopheles nili TaxID=185578 RepID=UPI00237C301F|nr:uncharacterized protein LOC128724821 [Anopheles nili]
MQRTQGSALIGLALFALGFGVVWANLNASGVQTSKQSYYFGTKDASDILCFSKTLLKGSTLPQDVTYTNPVMAKNIKFITLEADKYSSHGYTADITSGAIGTTTVTLKINGKSILPYSIHIKYYCVK